MTAIGVDPTTFSALVTYTFQAVFNAIIYIIELLTPFWIGLAIIAAILSLIYGAWALLHRHAKN